MKHKFYQLLLVIVLAISLVSTGYSEQRHHGGGDRHHDDDWNNAIIGLGAGLLIGSMFQSHDNSYYPYYPSDAYYGPRYRVCGWVGGYYDEFGYWIPRHRACWWQGR